MIKLLCKLSSNKKNTTISNVKHKSVFKM